MLLTKRFQRLLLVIVVTGCGIGMITNPVLAFPSLTTPSIPIDTLRLYKDVSYLTSLPSTRSYDHLRELNQAAAYISNEFKQLNIPIEEQTYAVDTIIYKNIIGSFGPTDEERIIIGAHYDVAGHQPGADDNASGVAGLLELARLLKQLAPQLKKRIDLVAYSLEEPPYFRTENMGSAVHAKMLHDKGIKVKAMISLEMIGYFSEKRGSQHYPLGILHLFYPSKANYITVVGKLGQGSLIRKIKRKMKIAAIDVRSINAPRFIPGIDFSDHLNYWNYGYDAVMITDTSFYRNNNYHRRSDTIETLNFSKMGEVVKGVFSAVVSMATTN